MILMIINDDDWSWWWLMIMDDDLGSGFDCLHNVLMAIIDNWWPDMLIMIDDDYE